MVTPLDGRILGLTLFNNNNNYNNTNNHFMKIISTLNTHLMTIITVVFYVGHFLVCLAF